MCHLWVLIHSPTDSTDFHGFSRNKFSDFQILNFSDSKNILADTLQYVEIKIISVKFTPIRGQNNLCQSAKSEVKEISAFPCAFAREKIMDAANHVHTKFLSSRYPEQFYLEYQRRTARDSRLRIVAVSHLGRKIYLPFVADAHLLYRDDPAFY